MIKRYEDPGIANIWQESAKLAAWQQTELAVIEARVDLGMVPLSAYEKIETTLKAAPADIDWWKAREKETQHDLQAWVDERVRHLPTELRRYFHEGMTSYDTEETAFLMLIRRSMTHVLTACVGLLEALRAMAIRYHYCPMMGVTHGQPGEIQTFGKRVLTWYQEVSLAQQRVARASEDLCFSRLSGAMGNYGGVTPEIEKRALSCLGFMPFYGATQILPRQLHIPTASALATLVGVISKIGTDIRLGARSPRPIYQEPFGKKQTGSSRMPHKKNTIGSEQLEGMERMALGQLVMIQQNVRTWEERAIEQSCVERIAWPDLFHVAMRSLTVCKKLISGLQVYPDNMILNIKDTRGAWTAGPAKEFLRERLAPMGITTEDAYRIVQLASFVASKPSTAARLIRENPPKSFDEADSCVGNADNFGFADPDSSIWDIVLRSKLEVVPALDVTDEQVSRWNDILRKFFNDAQALEDWHAVFSVQKRLADENVLFKQILGE